MSLFSLRTKMIVNSLPGVISLARQNSRKAGWQLSLCMSTSSDQNIAVKTPPNTLTGKLAMYAELGKYRLSSLVVMTTGAGFLCAGPPIDLKVMTAACIGTALCAASANTFNQVIETENDKKMNRTRMRPLPSNRVSKYEALTVAIAAGGMGTGILLVGTNPVVAALGAGNIFLYAGPYTVSKQLSELNTWIGSLVGAIPPVMGWAAATGGSLMSAEPVALALLLYLWQFPHFFALSWLHREDYARGGFQMVAVNDPTGERSASLIWRYSCYLTVLPIAASTLDMTSYMFAVEGTAANAYLLYLASNFNNSHSNGRAKKIFLCSLWYLPLLMFGFVFHNRLWSEHDETDKVSELILAAKKKMNEMCVHNILAQRNEGENQLMCPKMTADLISDGSIKTSTSSGEELITTETIKSSKAHTTVVNNQ